MPQQQGVKERTLPSTRKQAHPSPNQRKNRSFYRFLPVFQAQIAVLTSNGAGSILFFIETGNLGLESGDVERYQGGSSAGKIV
jgi:hypothetical protein